MSPAKVSACCVHAWYRGIIAFHPSLTASLILNRDLEATIKLTASQVPDLIFFGTRAWISKLRNGRRCCL